MSEKTKQRIFLIYGIIQSVLTVMCGVFLITACLAIYDGGNGTFSREAVTSRFSTVMIPVCLCILGILAGIVLTLALPTAPKKLKGRMHPSDAIRRLEARLNHQLLPPELTMVRRKEKNFRIMLYVLAVAVCVIVAIPCLIYLLNPANFDDIGTGLTQDILAAMKPVLSAAAVGLSAWIVVTLACDLSFKRELEVIKAAFKVSAAQNPKLSPARQTKPSSIWIVRCAVFLIAVVLIVLGIVNGGIKDVFEKAIRICTECIGLG